MATIYFSGSITGGRHDVGVYRAFIAVLEEAGHRVLAGSVASESVSASGDPLTPRSIFERDMAWLAECDVLVAEVSTPSTGAGYEIAAARYLHDIPVVCLYRPAYTKRCSAMVAGDARIALIEYRDGETDEAASRLLEAINSG
jgi:hypothetical protein